MASQVRIKPPSTVQIPQLFYSISYKQFVRIKVRFLVIFVGYPGSVQDSRVFKNIPLICHKLYSPGICLILGDGGYISANLPNTPYRETVTSPTEAWFNHHHSKAQNISPFGVMKSWWRSHQFHPCCLLCIRHNVCLVILLSQLRQHLSKMTTLMFCYETKTLRVEKT